MSARLWLSRLGVLSWSARVCGACAAIVVVLGLFAAGAAQAAPPKLIAYGSFAPAAGDVPLAVAVDQPSGDVYLPGLVNREEKPSIDKFDASGGSLLAPSPFGEASGFYLSAAVDPANGDLYVYSAFGSIATFDPNTGAPAGAPFAAPGDEEFIESFGSAPASQIGVDTGGDVYVPDPRENDVVEYSPAGGLLATFTGPPAAPLRQPHAVAVDSSGDLWVADRGNERIVELSPQDESLRSIRSPGVTSVALDGHGDVFAILANREDPCGEVPRRECAHLVVYSSSGAREADIGAGAFEAGKQLTALPPLVAVSEASGRVYVTDSSNESVWVFGPPLKPAVGRELTSEVSTSEAKLGALVNPGGIQTDYRFEYDTSEFREGEGPHGRSAPIPEGSAGEGINSRAVWAAAVGLEAGTTYHYRVVATSELGTVYGPDRTFTTLSAEQAACPNATLRGGFSARLPDCRAYELVTPPAKNSAGFDAAPASRPGIVAGNGDALLLSTKEPLPGAPSSGFWYVASRGATGWGVEDITPLESYTGVQCLTYNNEPRRFSDSYATSLFEFGADSRTSAGEGKEGDINESCNAGGVEVVAGEPVGYKNLLVRDSQTGRFQLVNAPPAGVTPADATYEGASADLSHVVFSEAAPLAPGAEYGVPELYEWQEGAPLRLVTFLPDGAPTTGSLAAPPVAGARGEAANEEAVSADGSRVLFTADGGLYARIDGERTVQVDKAHGDGAGPSGGGVFRGASPDGTTIFFTDDRRLTEGSTATAGKPDLYECALPAGAGECALSDLTVAKAGEHADVLDVLPLGGRDSSHVYFTARGVLAANAREYADGEGHLVGEAAESGQPNVYVWNGTAIVFIARLGEGDEGLQQVSPDGDWLSLSSKRSLTGYDNIPAAGGLPAGELFRYSAASGQLACASCNPTGEPPTAGGPNTANLGRARPLTDGGRLFFETQESLVPSDTNGQQDVYEFAGGQPVLISSGTSAQGSELIGASESGDDVFFASSQSLVPQDDEEGKGVVYDARVDGGVEAPASPPACVTADACRAPAPPQPPIYGAPSSQTFAGLGNLAPAAEVTPRKKAKPKRCARDHTEKKHRCGQRKRGKRTPKTRRSDRKRGGR